MPTNLTGTSIASTFDQVLHVDGGPTATEKTVYSGTGVATALKIGTASASVGDVQIVGNLIQATAGSLTLGSAIAFSSAVNARAALSLGSMATQDSGAVAITGGTVSGVTFSGSFTGLTLVESTTLATSAAAAGVNLNGNTLGADGTDANININIVPKGTGEVLVSGKMGHPTGMGGAVTQLTSRTTGVTLNKVTGEITLFAASITGHEADEFTLTNSFIAANDVIMLTIKSGCAVGTRKYYKVNVVSVSAGSCIISIGNIDNATIPATGTDSPVVQFIVLKGAVA